MQRRLLGGLFLLISVITYLSKYLFASIYLASVSGHSTFNYYYNFVTYLGASINKVAIIFAILGAVYIIWAEYSVVYKFFKKM